MNSGLVNVLAAYGTIGDFLVSNYGGNMCKISCGCGDPCFNRGPGRLCIEIVQGSLVSLEFLLFDSYGEPIDLTDETIVFTVKDKIGGDIMFFKGNIPGEHADPTNGRTIFEIENTDITPENPPVIFDWIYEVRKIGSTPGINDVIYLQGTFRVLPSVGTSWGD